MHRQNQVTRLNTAAMVAVRRTEAQIVRPILSERMAVCIGSFTDNHPDLDPLRFRVLLFRELHQQMRLGEEEKSRARINAINHLVDILQVMPHPPVKVKTDKQVSKQQGCLHECIETAYSLRPRPSAELLEQLAVFCGSNRLITT